MLGVSGLSGSSGDGAAAVAEAPESGGGGGGGGGGSSSGGGDEVSGSVGTNVGGFNEEDQKVKIEEGERNSGGNRWPRQETLELLKIRSDMDVTFRDSSLKGPLWEEVSRKLAELGYERSAKKCKEKFENVFKYHKRTKDGRSSKPDGKTYRFFDQLEALESHPSLPLLPPPRPQAVVAATTAAVAMPGTNPPIVSQGTVVSTINPINLFQNTVTPPLNPTNPSPPPPPVPLPTTNPANPSQSTANIPSSYLNMSANFISNSNSSSSTSSDEDLERRHRRKRKWKDFFERLMKEVIEKQEELQKKFLETLEKRERDRMVREEAWRVQEMARMNREHDLLAQERSISAAKDAAVIAFLQKISEQQNQNVTAQVQIPLQVQQNPLAPPPQPQPPPPPVVLQTPSPAAPPQPAKKLENPKTDNGGQNFTPASSSRWPKAEVEALIRLRTSLDLKYQESGPKGPLWEEMSAGMRKLGYNRNAKRCKEKWENINKYFKKVKESNKKRPEDSKTCPYFHQLDALYKERNKTDTASSSFINPGFAIKPENLMVPIMVRPEQQWPLPQEEQQPPQPEAAMEDQHDQSEHIDDQNHDDDEDGSDDDDEDEGGGYEIVTNKPSSVAMGE